MAFLAELWLPILLSAVLVFVVSSVLHMVVPIHKGDHKTLPHEAEVLATMREHGVTPGDYAFPGANSMQEMASPEYIEKCKQGPVGFVTVKPSGPPTMGAALVQWFLYSVLVSLFVAYIAWLALGPATMAAPGPEYMLVFRITGGTAVLGYAFSNFVNSIWKGQSWVTSFKFLFDGVIYGLVTAGTFAWLWPTPA